MADVALDRLLGEEEPYADLAVHQAVRDELEDFDLPRRRLLLQFLERSGERNDLRAAAAAGGDRVEPPRMLAVAVQDLVALCSVHGPGIGLARVPL